MDSYKGYLKILMTEGPRRPCHLDIKQSLRLTDLRALDEIFNLPTGGQTSEITRHLGRASVVKQIKPDKPQAEGGHLRSPVSSPSERWRSV